MSAMDISRLAPGHFRQLRPGLHQPPPPAARPHARPAPPSENSRAGAVTPPVELVALCRLPVMHRLLELAQRRLVLLAFESQLEADYRRGHPYASAMELACAVYGDPRYEQMVNRLKFADSAQCARMLAARIARDSSSPLAVCTATAEGFGSEFVLVATQMDQETSDWHTLPDDAVLMDPWGQRQGPARGLLIAAGLASSLLSIQRIFS